MEPYLYSPCMSSWRGQGPNLSLCLTKNHKDKTDYRFGLIFLVYFGVIDSTGGMKTRRRVVGRR